MSDWPGAACIASGGRSDYGGEDCELVQPYASAQLDVQRAEISLHNEERYLLHNPRNYLTARRREHSCGLRLHTPLHIFPKIYPFFVKH